MPAVDADEGAAECPEGFGPKDKPSRLVALAVVSVKWVGWIAAVGEFGVGVCGAAVACE